MGAVENARKEGVAGSCAALDIAFGKAKSFSIHGPAVVRSQPHAQSVLCIIIHFETPAALRASIADLAAVSAVCSSAEQRLSMGMPVTADASSSLREQMSVYLRAAVTMLLALSLASETASMAVIIPRRFASARILAP